MEAVQDGSANVGGEGIRFVYDNSGARVIKMDTLQSMTAYVNQFYVVQNPESPSTSLATKEIFIGNNRIAAQMTGSAVTTSVTTTSNTNVSPTAAWVGAWGVSLAPGNTDAANFGSPGNFITIEKNNTPVMSANPIGWTQPNPVLGIVNATQIMTLQNPDPSNGYFVVAYGGQTGYVQENAAVVGFPVTISTNNTSLMPKGSLVFFYHTDQIGSTGYMTDATGTLSEHLEYIPFGETWIQQERGTQVLPNYQFSGKELDTETGLYYFGARYYDPRISLWENPDPILDKYLNGKGNEGVYNSFNLGLYTYVQQNPVLLTDPDGNLGFILLALAALELTADTGTVVGVGGLAYTAGNKINDVTAKTPQEHQYAQQQMKIGLKTSSYGFLVSGVAGVPGAIYKGIGLAARASFWNSASKLPVLGADIYRRASYGLAAKSAGRFLQAGLGAYLFPSQVQDTFSGKEGKDSSGTDALGLGFDALSGDKNAFANDLAATLRSHSDQIGLSVGDGKSSNSSNGSLGIQKPSDDQVKQK